MSRVLAAKTWGPLHALLPDLTRSDHFPFWRAGLPAGARGRSGHEVSDTFAVLQDAPDLNPMPAGAQVGAGQRIDRRLFWIAAAVAAVCLIGALAIAVVHFGQPPPSFRPLVCPVTRWPDVGVHRDGC